MLFIILPLENLNVAYDFIENTSIKDLLLNLKNSKIEYMLLEYYPQKFQPKEKKMDLVLLSLAFAWFFNYNFNFFIGMGITPIIPSLIFLLTFVFTLDSRRNFIQLKTELNDLVRFCFDLGFYLNKLDQQLVLLKTILFFLFIIIVFFLIFFIIIMRQIQAINKQNNQ